LIGEVIETVGGELATTAAYLNIVLVTVLAVTGTETEQKLEAQVRPTVVYEGRLVTVHSVPPSGYVQVAYDSV